MLVCTILVGLACMPCFVAECATFAAVPFTNWVCTRLHVFVRFIVYLDVLVLMVAIGVVPDWIVHELVAPTVLLITWILVHLERTMVSSSTLLGLYATNRFRERCLLDVGGGTCHNDSMELARRSWAILASIWQALWRSWCAANMWGMIVPRVFLYFTTFCIRQVRRDSSDVATASVGARLHISGQSPAGGVLQLIL